VGTNLEVRNSPPKGGVILDGSSSNFAKQIIKELTDDENSYSEIDCRAKLGLDKDLSLLDRPARYQLVGKVMAYQGNDA